MAHGRTGELHVRQEILASLSDGKERTTEEIRRRVRKLIPPTEGDAERASKRENETKYDAIVANALQAGRVLCKAQLIKRTGVGRFRITLLGLEEHRQSIMQLKAFSRTADELYSDEDWR